MKTQSTLRLALFALAITSVAACKSGGDDKPAAAKAAPATPAPEAPKPATPPAEEPAPALVELDLSSAGDAWKGMSIQAPAGSVAKDETVYLDVLGPDGSGWGIQILPKDAFDAMTKDRRANPKFKTAVIEEADRFVATTASSGSFDNYSVVVRTKVGDKSFSCTDLRVITSRTMADSYVTACASLSKK